MKINVLELAGSACCVTAEQGELLYQKIVAGLNEGDVIDLDFSGTAVFASSFFNALGRLVERFPISYLHDGLKFTGLTPDGHQILRRVIDNAKKHFQKADASMPKTAEFMLREMKDYFHQLALLNQREGKTELRDANRHARDMMQTCLDELDDQAATKAADLALSNS